MGLCPFREQQVPYNLLFTKFLYATLRIIYVPCTLPHYFERTPTSPITQLFGKTIKKGEFLFRLSLKFEKNVLRKIETNLCDSNIGNFDKVALTGLQQNKRNLLLMNEGYFAKALSAIWSCKIAYLSKLKSTWAAFLLVEWKRP